MMHHGNMMVFICRQSLWIIPVFNNIHNFISFLISQAMSQHDLVFPVPVVLYTISLYFSSVMSHDPAFPVPGVFFSLVPAIILEAFSLFLI